MVRSELHLQWTHSPNVKLDVLCEAVLSPSQIRDIAEVVEAIETMREAILDQAVT